MADEQLLLSIIAHARSGATGYAWRMVRSAGLDRANDDPSALSVVGRLLKDEAIRATGETRQKFYHQSAAYYSRAAEISGATYPLINAATLSLLAGNRPQAEILAQQVLDKQLRHEDEPETPYWRAATKSEVLLLLDDLPQAREILSEAIKLAPRAYEDHASTLRQFGLILEVLGVPQSWLDDFRPPRCLHFAGHMGVAGDDEVIQERISTIIRRERVGFGFGALAAGTDILVAESLLASDIELHLVLPANPAAFRTVSVAPYGERWVKRYETVLKLAKSVRSPNTGSNPISSDALQLAAEVAMGRAIMQADVLQTEAIQLAILDGNGDKEGQPGSSTWMQAVWKQSDLRQHVLVLPRVSFPVQTIGTQHASSGFEKLAAVLRIELTYGDTFFLSRDAVINLANVVTANSQEILEHRWTGEGLFLVLRNAAAAAHVAFSAAEALAGSADFRIAGHYGVVSYVNNPLGAGTLLVGPASAIPNRTLQSTPPGAVHITEDLAAALHTGPKTGRSRTEYVGELPDIFGGPPIRLFALGK
jgi:hypothetical protein